MKLSIIIVNYNTGALTKSLLESILPQKVAGGLEVIVVDNDSRDESVAFLRSDFPEVTVIDAKTNHGLAAGVNIGLAQARGAYVLLLNPDMIALPGSLQALVNFMDSHPKVGLAGGKLLSPNGLLQRSAFRFYSIMTILYRRTWLGRTQAGKRELARFTMQDTDFSAPLAVDWLQGSCMILRRKALDKVGGMDERFFLYFEDVDWCRRFWEAGWQVMFTPAAEFSHFHQRSSERGLLSIFTNRPTREHITSAIKYFLKYIGHKPPHAIMS